jgi:hypothetical protein
MTNSDGPILDQLWALDAATRAVIEARRATT